MNALGAVELTRRVLKCPFCKGVVGEAEGDTLYLPHKYHGEIEVTFSRYKGKCHHEGCGKPFLFAFGLTIKVS